MGKSTTEKAPEIFWMRMTAAEINARAKEDAIVLLPVASVEQHGPHLGTGVDTFLVTEGCRRIALKLAAAKRPIVVAPTVWMGLAEHHIAFGGTFTLSMSTYHALLRDLCRSILRAGFRKILLVNGHGGNMSALATLMTDLAQELEAPIAETTLYTIAHQEGLLEPILEDQVGVQHACEAETSMMLAAHPDCVRKALVKVAFNGNGVDKERRLGLMGQPINLWRSFREMSDTGVMGDARRASADKGEKILAVVTDAIAARLIAGKPWN
jgi:creatinine amidohydrolase